MQIKNSAQHKQIENQNTQLGIKYNNGKQCSILHRIEQYKHEQYNPIILQQKGERPKNYQRYEEAKSSSEIQQQAKR